MAQRAAIFSDQLEYGRERPWVQHSGTQAGPVERCLALDDGPEAYRFFCDKADGCIKVVLRP